jgi:enamine deaminase RidA (YjgF/YER057c/UK114 family)
MLEDMRENRRLPAWLGKVFLLAVTFGPGVPAALGAQGPCKVNPATLAFSPGYAQLVVAPDRRTVHVAGQVAQDSTGVLVGAGDATAQVRAVFANLRRALDAVGAGWGDVLSWTIYVTSPDVVPAFRQVRLEVLAGIAPPAATLVQVQALARADWLVEVEAVVAAPRPLVCAALKQLERPAARSLP